MSKIKQRLLRKLEQEKSPKWSIKALERFEWYFFIVGMVGFLYFVIFEPAFVTQSWFTLNFLIGLVAFFTCWGQCKYIRWWIDRKQYGYQLYLKRIG